MPMPMPACAPVERPEDASGLDVAEAVSIADVLLLLLLKLAVSVVVELVELVRLVDVRGVATV